MIAHEDKLDTARAWMRAGRRVALATVIDTWGSSPRPVGSQLVVDADGNFEGSVSGGCIESTVVTEAQYATGAAAPLRLSVGVSDRQAWDTGLACGGSVEILVESAALWQPVMARLSALRREHRCACLVTRLDTGEKTLVTPTDPPSDTGLPADILAAARGMLAAGPSRVLAAGDLSFFLHRWAPEPQMVIIGAVHIAQCLAAMARTAGYRVVVVDPRLAWATSDRFPDTTLVCRRPRAAFDEIALHGATAVVALSHSPAIDDPALARALGSDAFYIGALGSRASHAARLERLGRAGFGRRALARIHGPVGLPIGGATPAEIAVSILAEVTQVRRMGPRPGEREGAA